MIVRTRSVRYLPRHWQAIARTLERLPNPSHADRWMAYAFRLAADDLRDSLKREGMS